MPLLDHFHPPISQQRHWESFHAVWAGEIMAALNLGGLPPGYYAETQVHLGSRIEVDIGTFEGPDHVPEGTRGNGVATATTAEVMVLPVVYPDDIEVQVFHNSGGATLVAAIELISPGNKDRTEARRAFAAKCLSYLQRGVGVVIVDIVTDRHANLHNELITLLGLGPETRMAEEARLYLVAYRPLSSLAHGNRIEARPATLTVGEAIPCSTLALRAGPRIVLDLEGPYTQARRRCLLG